MAYHVLVTPEVNQNQKNIIRDILDSDQTSVHFLQAVTGKRRNKILEVADILLTFDPFRDLSKDEYEHLNHIQFMQLISAGADHLPYEKIPLNIKIASNSGAYAEPIAEHVVAMALHLAKRLGEEHQNMVNGQFNQFTQNKFIKKSTVGILGFGGIGKATARLFRSFGSQIFAMNTRGESEEPTDFMGTKDDLYHILESSDIVVISLPLNKHTRDLIGHKELNSMKSEAILINVARGEIIHQKDLYEHLKAHKAFKAGIESWWVEPLRHGSFELEFPLLDLPNVLAAPHNSSMVPGNMDHGFEEAAKNIKKYLYDKSYKGKINRKDYQ